MLWEDKQYCWRDFSAVVLFQVSPHLRAFETEIYIYYGSLEMLLSGHAPSNRESKRHNLEKVKDAFDTFVSFHIGFSNYLSNNH